MCYEIDQCTIRSLLRKYISEYKSRVKYAVRNTLRRVRDKLRYRYIMLFGNVRSKLMLEMEARLRAYTIALGGALSSAITDGDSNVSVKAVAYVINEIIRSACGLCIIEHGDNVDLVAECVKHKVIEAIHRSICIILPIALPRIMVSALNTLSSVLEAGGDK